MIRSIRASWLLLTLALPWVLPVQAQAVRGVLESPAMQVPNAKRAVFSDIARAGERLVAVGERGLILLSDDNGQHWQQASVPVSVGLTAVEFVDAEQGWAVGHAGVVLASSDGGANWAVQLDGSRAAQLELSSAQAALNGASDADAAEARVGAAQRLVEDGADKPFLNLHFTDAHNGLVIGAYGMAFQTRDGGRSWQSRMGQIDNPMGLHLYAVAQQGQDWYLAGEQGFLARSADAGAHFQQLESPYEGTFFTLSVRADGSLLLGGLKGHAFVLRDAGSRVEPLAVTMPVSFSDSASLSDGRTLLANQAGALFSVAADGTRLQLFSPPAGKPLAALTQAADGSLVAAGFTGLSRLSLSATKVSE
ncbi:BNR domain-containing protein [Pseudomonas stutzeri]|uniref:YCF48-related protein n=1 Tax=Stutzerimonas stutzeri TaxID=316 RepID=UPI001F52B03B|nr:YCF48-related protein [Stutzerimonas stutzeri]MCI0916275.1 BNR domain-containing protein [Stutzerimonas stutzeri]